VTETIPDHLHAKLLDIARELYARGFKDGQDSTTSRIFEALGGKEFSAKPVISEPRLAQATGHATGAAAVIGVGRAARGSVEPRVYAALDGSVKGKKAAEIAGETGIPENSVRGTLNKLRKDGTVSKTGEVWHLANRPPVPGGNENPDAKAPGA
jgi:hypothetical protein